MRISDESLDELEQRGFVLVEGFVSGRELAEAQAGLWDLYPRPEAYFADPEQHRWLSRHAFAGMKLFPYPAWALNRLAFHPDLVDAAERYLGSSDLELYKIELWAKYAGAAEYDQPHHRDFANHTLVVPVEDGRYRQLTSFLLLSDVTHDDGPTRLVPLQHTDHIPFVPAVQEPGTLMSVPHGELFEHEVAAVGPAGSLLLYRTDVFHRGSGFSTPRRARFALLADYQVRGAPFTGKMAWPQQAISPWWPAVIEQASVRERDLFGFPTPGDPFWSDETCAGVQARYPAMDMAPYRADLTGRR